MILGLLLFFTPGLQTYEYWVEPCKPSESACEEGDTALADWSMEAWQRASDGHLKFAKVASEKQAQIRLYWAGARQGLYGEARPIWVDGKRGAEVYVLPAHVDGDRLLRDTIVYLTCLHETGHALGLDHTNQFADIMYSFQYGGDIPEYFGRYRRKLKSRADIRSESGMSPADREHLAAVLKRAE
ncbi:MAG: matrixin family metalloprotease [Acidobacteriaceae bacterium]|nr:matrixin family metalloprotease [Acidobacteriaceae bacterium]